MIDLSSYAQTLDKKNAAVFGLGLSGLTTVKSLISAGVAVTAFDDKQENCDKAQHMGAHIEDLTTADLSNFDFLVLAPGVPYTYQPHAVVTNAQKHNLEIIGDLELLHRSGHGVRTIGITGTNGKSTTTALLTHVLNECGVKAVMGGNIGKPVLEMDLANIDALVLEISSYQIDLCTTYSPDISILLNVTPDHLDRHGSMEEYVKAKARIFGGAGVGIIAIDDDFTMALFDKMLCQSDGRVLHPVSVKGEVPEGVFVEKSTLKTNHNGTNNDIGSIDGLETLKGLHNQQNIICVYKACKEFGLQDEDILKALSSYPGLPHRQYLVTQENNVSYINDSKATNAEAAAKALSSYDDIYWIVGGRSKDGGLKGLGVFQDKIKQAYLIGEATQDFGRWFKTHGFDFMAFHSLEEATQAAHDDAQKAGGGNVLLSPACASWDQFTSFEARGDVFANKVLALVGKD